MHKVQNDEQSSIMMEAIGNKKRQTKPVNLNARALTPRNMHSTQEL